MPPRMIGINSLEGYDSLSGNSDGYRRLIQLTLWSFGGEGSVSWTVYAQAGQEPLLDPATLRLHITLTFNRCPYFVKLTLSGRLVRD